MPQFSSPYLKEEAPGVWRGATTFEEFRANVGDSDWPARLASGGGGNRTIVDEDPDLEAIAIAQSDANMGHAWDLHWSDMFRTGEILIRFYIDAYASGFRVKMGVGPRGEFSQDGTEVQVLVFSNTVRSAIRRLSDATNHGAGVNHGDLDPGSGLPYYLWCRMRIDDAGGGNFRVRYKITNGDYDTPPDGSVWDEDVTFAADDVGPWESRIGLWIRSTAGPTQLSERRVAFYSFTGDPDTYPLLLTDDVVNDSGIAKPEITAVDPLQATYVGLVGSAFEQIQSQDQGFQVPAAPAVITNDAIGAWIYSHFKNNDDGQRLLVDQSGSGNHLLFGGNGVFDSYLGRPPFINKVGVFHGGIGNRSLGLPNTGQQYNVGAAGVNKVRFTVNFTCSLSVGGTKVIIAFNNGLGNYAFHWQVDGSQNLLCWMTNNGSTNLGGSVGAALTTPFNSWDDMWLRVEYDMVADLCTVETSTDGSTWSPFGTVAITGAGPMYQPPAAADIDLGIENNFSANTFPSCCIFSIKAEEDSGAGYVDAWEEIMANRVIDDFTKAASWGAVAASDPLERESSMRYDGGSGRRMTTWWHSQARQVDQQFDVAAGEVLTAIEVWSQDNVDAGPQGSIAKRNRDAVGDAGWGAHINAGTGSNFQVSDGATESATTPAALGDGDFKLVCRIYEIDGPDGEIRHRALNGTPQVDAYGDQGGGSPVFGVSIGSYPSGFDTPNGNWLGSAVFKKELTVAEMQEVATYLSGGRL